MPVKKCDFYFKDGWFVFELFNWICLNLESPFKTMNKLKGVFKPLKCHFSTRIPILWCSKPSYIQITARDVGWKDKYNTPRYEEPPYIWIHLFGFDLIWYWSLNKNSFIDDYWEQALWYLYYYNTYSQGLLDKANIEKARESWPWQDYETKKSTWNDKFLVK
jgi:hypothetical protein